MKDFPEQLFKH